MKEQHEFFNTVMVSTWNYSRSTCAYLNTSYSTKCTVLQFERGFESERSNWKLERQWYDTIGNLQFPTLLKAFLNTLPMHRFAFKMCWMRLKVDFQTNASILKKVSKCSKICSTSNSSKLDCGHVTYHLVGKLELNLCS